MSAWNPALWRSLSPLLDHALDLEPGRRAAFVDAVRAETPDLADTLQMLLAEHEQLLGSGFLETPLPEAAASTLAGVAVGHYTLDRQLGMGGMGSVWLGHRSDGRFEGAVAIKLLNLALLDPQGRARFAREGTLLARLAHPGVARLFDAGVTPAGQPYLVLEYVEGTPIDRFADDRRLDVPARLALFLQVADAVAHAHANLVVHRDLKPSNLLVDIDGRVKLLDFGIATVVDRAGDGTSAATWTATRAFTPAYAAPEQVTHGAITTATDVYALGVLLHRLLVGVHPTAGPDASPAEVLRALTDREPPLMSVVAHGLPDDAETARLLGARAATREGLVRACRGDLDVVVATALKKAPEERYQTVSALADDVRAHLEHQPVSVRPDSIWYRARKLAERRRWEVASAAVAVLALLAASAVAVWQARTATAERDFARRQLARAQAVNELNEFLLSDAAPVGQPFTAGQVLARAERSLARQPPGAIDARVASLVTIGQQYAVQDEDANAVRVLEQAYALSRQSGDPSVRAQAGCALAAALAAVGTDARPAGLLREAFAELPDSAPFALDRVFCRLRAGNVERFGATPEAALPHVEAARDILAAAPVSSAVLDQRVAMDLAESYRVAGRNAEAAAHFERAWAALQEHGRDDTETAGTLLNNWALTLREQPILAEPLLRRAIAIGSADGTEASVSPMLLNNMGFALMDLGRYGEGIAKAERAGQAAAEAGSGAVLFRNQLLRARLHVEAGDPRRAVAALEEFERTAATLVPAGHVAYAVRDMLRGRIATIEGRADAGVWFDRALAYAGLADAWNLRWSVLQGRVLQALVDDRADVAVAEAEAALSLAREHREHSGPTLTIGRSQYLLGRALAASGRNAEARAALQQAAAELEATAGGAHPEVVAARELLARPASP
jgi:serine/threonine protein kinase/tetratricopeptide (TPR) repeat protein